MGDGPAYDYAYARAAEAAKRKRETQKKRAAALLNVMHTVGFGESDGELSALETEAARCLRMAYDLFSMISRQG